jgi:hypothetical protein
MMIIMSDACTLMFSRSVIDDSRVMLQLVMSFLIVIYDRHIFIVQATGCKPRSLPTGWGYSELLNSARLTQKCWTSLKNLAKEEHSSLFCSIINDEENFL